MIFFARILFLTLITTSFALQSVQDDFFEKSAYTSAGIAIGNILTIAGKAAWSNSTEADHGELKCIGTISAINTFLSMHAQDSVFHSGEPVTRTTSFKKNAKYFFSGIALGSIGHIPIKYTNDHARIGAPDFALPVTITIFALSAARMCS